MVAPAVPRWSSAGGRHRCQRGLGPHTAITHVIDKRLDVILVTDTDVGRGTSEGIPGLREGCQPGLGGHDLAARLLDEQHLVTRNVVQPATLLRRHSDLAACRELGAVHGDSVLGI